MNVNLYTTVGCHLCDEALAMLKSLQAQGKRFSTREIEIADCDELMAKYSIRIPVVTIDTAGGDIGWPFTPDELAQFLNLE